jgi:hypothetical protein
MNMIHAFGYLISNIAAWRLYRNPDEPAAMAWEKRQGASLHGQALDLSAPFSVSQH